MGWFSKLFGRGAAGEEQPNRSVRRPTLIWRADSYPMEVVGESHYQDALMSICGPHSRYGHDVECDAAISLDPTNAFDPNAVKVSIQGRHIGFLNRDQAVRVGGAMRSLNLTVAVSKARIAGGWRTNQHDEGHFGVRLSIPKHGPLDFGSAGTWSDGNDGRDWPKKPKVERPAAAETGPLVGQRVAIMGQARDGELARTLAGAGAHIASSIGKTTTMLIVAGDEPPFQFGTRRSSTYQKAESFIAAGSPLRVLSEKDVRALLND